MGPSQTLDKRRALLDFRTCGATLQPQTLDNGALLRSQECLESVANMLGDLKRCDRFKSKLGKFGDIDFDFVGFGEPTLPSL